MKTPFYRRATHMWSSPLAESLPTEHPFGIGLLTVHTVYQLLWSPTLLPQLRSGTVVRCVTVRLCISPSTKGFAYPSHSALAPTEIRLTEPLPCLDVFHCIRSLVAVSSGLVVLAEVFRGRQVNEHNGRDARPHTPDPIRYGLRLRGSCLIP